MRKPLYYYLYTRSPILKIFWGIVSTVAMLAIIAFVGFTEEGRMEAQTDNWDARSIEKGAALFANNCASCHGADGRGLPNVAPALNSRYFFSDDVTIDGETIPAGRLTDVGWAGSRKNYVMLTVAAGRPSKADAHWSALMATWGIDYGGPLRNDQVIAVANYVLNWEEEALAQTPEEDPWQFFRDSLAEQLPYHPDEPGYEIKLAEALAAAEAAGVSNYELNGEVYTFEQPDEAEVVGPRSPQELRIAMGCAGCHSMDPDSDVQLPGPPQYNIHEIAGSRVEGQTAEEYVYESIVNPGAYLVEGYQNLMPGNFADQMTEEEIQGLVAWFLDPNREE